MRRCGKSAATANYSCMPPGLWILAVLLLAACVPTHTVKPLPNFIDVALEPGDRVRITLRDDTVHEFEIREIRGDTLVSTDEEFKLQDIVTIQKYAWARPESPCGGQKKLGCSVPLLLSLASDSHSHYESVFYDACAQHDYCYRHGFASYGMNRKSCDDEFLADMKKTCPRPATSKMGKFLEVMDGSLDSRQTCLSVASDYYGAVRRYGEEKFQSVGTSTYCEYNGPPVGRAPTTAPTSTEP